MSIINVISLKKCVCEPPTAWNTMFERTNKYFQLEFKIDYETRPVSFNVNYCQWDTVNTENASYPSCQTAHVFFIFTCRGG